MMKIPAGYVLDGKNPIPVYSIDDWLPFQTADRTVKKTTIGERNISTVFLGVDYGDFYDESGCISRPSLFETMVFSYNNDKWNNFCKRYSTWDESESGHEEICEAIRSDKSPEDL